MPLAALFFGKLGLLTVVTIFVVAALAWYVAFKQVPLADTAVTVLGVMYVAFGLTHLVLARALDAGALLVLTILFSVWAADVGAYFVGSLLGRHKLAPSTSPGKSWEGFAGGILGSVLVWAAAYQIADTGLAFAWHIGIGVAVAVAGLFGDLLESRIKREVGVKDSGTILPGHGGFLDRFDSLIIVAVVAYYLLAWGGPS
jgi:phosphatidate cytidylyltransferase